MRPARRARNVYIETRCHQFHTLFQYTHCCGRVPKDAHRDPNIIHFYTQGTQRIARSLPQETHQKKTRACKYIFLIMINSLRTNACGNTRNIALQLATQQSEQCCATSCTILFVNNLIDSTHTSSLLSVTYCCIASHEVLITSMMK